MLPPTRAQLGILSQAFAERIGKPDDIRTEFTLVNEGSTTGVQVFDRVLDRDDMNGFALVDVMEQRRERRALAAAGGAGEEHKPVRVLGQRDDFRR